MVKVINTFGIEQGGTALNAMNLVIQVQKVFGQVRTVLAGNASNETYFTQLSAPIFDTLNKGYRRWYDKLSKNGDHHGDFWSRWFD
jgi:hypothetical protein